MKLLIRILHRDFRAILYRISYIPLKRQYPTHFYFSPQLVFISLRRTISLLFSREKCKSKIRCLPLLLPLPSPHFTNNPPTNTPIPTTATHTKLHKPHTPSPNPPLQKNRHPGSSVHNRHTPDTGFLYFRYYISDTIFQIPYLPIYFH